MSLRKNPFKSVNPPNPIVIDDPFRAGAFVATMVGFCRMNHAGARETARFHVVVNDSGAFEVHLEREMKLYTYASIMEDVNRWMDRHVGVHPRPAVTPREKS